MRYFKSHPALAALVAFLVLGAIGGAAYAVVREVWITIDPDESAPQIEQDVHDQLEAAGMPATVHAEKLDGGKLKLSIQQLGSASDDDIGSALHIAVAGQPAEQKNRQLRLEIGCDLDDAQRQQLIDVASSSDMIAVLAKDYDRDSDLLAAVVAVFEAHGFHHVLITTGDDGIHAKITAPPT